jgi:hypothetical protein
VDAILVWRLDRWGRSLPDLVVTLKELAELSIGFVSLTEAFDMTTPTGRALAGMLAVFAEFEHEILRERVKAGIAQARAKGSASLARYTGRPPWRATSRLTVDAAHCSPLAISRIDEPDAMPREMSSRSVSVSVRPERRRTAGTMPPCCDNRN